METQTKPVNNLIEVGENKENTFFNGKEWIPVTSMSIRQLQIAKLKMQKKELKYFTKMMKCSDVVNMIDEEAGKRGFTINDLNSEWHKNARVLKNSSTDHQ